MTKAESYIQSNREDYGINWSLSGFRLSKTSVVKYSVLMNIKNSIEPQELLPERIAADLRTIAQIIEEESWQRQDQKGKE